MDPSRHATTATRGADILRKATVVCNGSRDGRRAPAIGIVQDGQSSPIFDHLEETHSTSPNKEDRLNLYKGEGLGKPEKATTTTAMTILATAVATIAISNNQ